MSTHRTEAPSTSRLAMLLSRCEAWPDPEVLAEARALGTDTASALVNVLLAGALRLPPRDGTAAAACALAGALQLEATLPRLVALVDAARTPLRLHLAAVRAIGRMGLAALGPLGVALDEARAAMERHRTAGEEKRFSSAVARLGRHLEAAAELHAALRAEPAMRAMLAQAEALARGERAVARVGRTS
jgi:hypothetical protein